MRRPRELFTSQQLRQRALLTVFSLALGCAVVAIAASPALSTTPPPSTTLTDYHQRVHVVRLALDALSSPDDEAGAAEQDERVTWVINKTRVALPPHEHVMWHGGTVQVDNTWLHQALDEYSRVSSTDTPEARAATLARITERLHALDQRLADINPEGEGATHAAAQQQRDKEKEKGRLAAILRRPEYDWNSPPGESALTRFFKQIWDQLLNWLNQLSPQPGGFKIGSGLHLTNAARYFIYGLCLIITGLVLWRFGRWYLQQRALNTVTLPREPRIVLGHKIAHGQTPHDLLTAAEQLARRGDIRGAIRQAYIALLFELGERNIIRLAQHKTNRDYLHALKGERATLYREMQPLTANYERHWYGDEDATAEDWINYHVRCREVLKQ